MNARARSALLCLLAVCGGGCEKSPRPGGRFILISLDTLRADHLGAYGYGRPTSPFIDSLAARGTLFENAIAQLPGTLPSHMSIFTGLYPAEHGVYPPDAVLAPQIRTLPEVLRAHGLRTGGHVEGGYVEGRYGFSRGFEEWSDDDPFVEREGELRKSTDAVKRTFGRGLEFLRRVRPSESFFLFLHTYSVHDPYDPPEPYRSLYWTGPPPPGCLPSHRDRAPRVQPGSAHAHPGALEYYKALYDAQINYTDDVVAEFFAGVKALGLADDVTVILTSTTARSSWSTESWSTSRSTRRACTCPSSWCRPGPREPRGCRRSSRASTSPPPSTRWRRCRSPPGRARPGEASSRFLSGGRAAEGREAHAEAFVTRDRVLYRQSSGALHTLVRRQPAAAAAEEWARGPLRFETLERGVRFWIASYWEPRELRVKVNDTPAGTHRIDTAGRWLELELPPGEHARNIEIGTPTCTVPRAVRGRRRPLPVLPRQGSRPHHLGALRRAGGPSPGPDLVHELPPGPQASRPAGRLSMEAARRAAYGAARSPGRRTAPGSRLSAVGASATIRVQPGIVGPAARAVRAARRGRGRAPRGRAACG